MLAPGFAIARALGLRSASATLAWALAAVFGALAVTFLVGGSLALTLGLLLAVGIVALAAGRRAPRAERVPGRWWVFGAGAVLGLLLWSVAGEIGGDGLFHLARVRKLDAFGSLSLDSVNEFADGGLHPGYAFPLWHGFLALVARVAFVDPADVVLHEASVLAPLALLVAYEAGWALFRRVGPAVAVVCAQVGITALAPNGGGAYTALGLPATASRQLLVPAALALAIAAAARPSRALLASTAAAGLVLAVVHPTYALFLWLPFAGFLVVRVLVVRSEARAIAAALAALVVPAGLYLAWLLPVVRETRSVRPAADELERALRQYEGQLDVFSETSYRLAPEVFGRVGAVAVAALLCVPLAGLALRRRWAAYVLGGSLAIFLVLLVPALFVPFSDAVSLSQSRRAAGFLPFAFAFAGGLLVLAGFLRLALLPVALAAGIVLQLLYPGDFGYRLVSGGPALATWIAAVGGALALVGGLVLQRHSSSGRRSSRQRERRLSSTSSLGARRHRGCALRPPRRDPRCLELERLGRAAAEPAHRRARRGAARGGAARRCRLLRPRDELPDRRRGAGLHRRSAARPRRRHRGQPALRAPAREPPLLPRPATSRSRAPPARAGSSSTATASTSPRSFPSSTATSASRSTDSARRLSSIERVKLLLVTLYWPPAGGGGVQRPLKFAQYLPALGIETHVLAPDDPKWIHEDADLRAPTQAWVHRARYVGPEGAQARRGAARQGGRRPRARAREAGLAPAARSRRERELEPDRDSRPRSGSRAARGSTSCSRPRRRTRSTSSAPPSSARPARNGSPTSATRSSRTRTAAPTASRVRAKEKVARRRRPPRRPPGRRDHLRLGGDRGRGARLRAARPCGDDLERLRLRRLRRAPVHARRHASGSRTPAASSASATRARS